MEILQDGFNSDDVPPSTGFDAIPAGKYKVVVAESEEKKTKKGDGSYLQLTFVIVDGEFTNRKLWARLNLNNPNDQAVGIARAELSAICRSVGVRKLSPGKGVTEIHDIPLVVRVAKKFDDIAQEDRNEIKGYEAVNAEKKETVAAAGGKAPWKK